jgi:hypothetical protein
MAVMLVLYCASTSAERAQLLSALRQHGARRLLGTTWVFPETESVESAERLLSLYLPPGDGYLLTVAAGHLVRPLGGDGRVG